MSPPQQPPAPEPATSAAPAVPEDETVALSVSGDTRAELVQAIVAELRTYIGDESALEWSITRLDVAAVPPEMAHAPQMRGGEAVESKRYSASVIAEIHLR